MHERNIVAAILAGNLATQVREKGNSFAVAAEHSVMLYEAILKELAKADLPPTETDPLKPSQPPTEPAPKPRART